jgi:hypothetical protein
MNAPWASTVGPILLGLLISSSVPARPSLPPQPSRFILLSQIIVSNPKPPTQQGPTGPLEPSQKNPGPCIDQDPQPRIAENPQPPLLQQSK